MKCANSTGTVCKWGSRLPPQSFWVVNRRHMYQIKWLNLTAAVNRRQDWGPSQCSVWSAVWTDLTCAARVGPCLLWEDKNTRVLLMLILHACSETREKKTQLCTFWLKPSILLTDGMAVWRWSLLSFFGDGEELHSSTVFSRLESESPDTFSAVSVSSLLRSLACFSTVDR